MQNGYEHLLEAAAKSTYEETRKAVNAVIPSLPWRIAIGAVNDDFHNPICILQGEGPQEIVVCKTQEIQDARLISAAPELFRAVTLFMEAWRALPAAHSGEHTMFLAQKAGEKAISKIKST